MAIRDMKRSIKIPVTYNIYKDTLNDFTKSLDEDFQYQSGLIDKGSYRASRFKDNLRDLLKGKNG